MHRPFAQLSQHTARHPATTALIGIALAVAAVLAPSACAQTPETQPRSEQATQPTPPAQAILLSTIAQQAASTLEKYKPKKVIGADFAPNGVYPWDRVGQQLGADFPVQLEQGVHKLHVEDHAKLLDLMKPAHLAQDDFVIPVVAGSGFGMQKLIHGSGESCLRRVTICF